MFDEAVDVIDVAGWPDTWRPDRGPDHAGPEDPFADVRLVDGEPVPRPTPATTAPSGAFALELDWATAHPEMLTAAELVDAVVGMATLAAYLTATEATASYEWITRLARGVQPGVCDGASDNGGGTSSAEDAQRAGRGSMDRRRADVLVALLTGRLVATAASAAAPATTAETADGSDDNGQAVVTAPVSAHRPLIHVTAPTTLLGVDDEPGELAGYGPSPPPSPGRSPPTRRQSEAEPALGLGGMACRIA